MTPVRETVLQFINQEGHRVDVSALEDGNGAAELLFRTRGQVYSITTNESDPAAFSIATAYEIPDLARENLNNAETLAAAQNEFLDVDFAMAHDGSLFIVSTQKRPGSPEAFTKEFWAFVARVREAGSYAIERIIDRSESTAAANKFISSLTMGER